MVCMHMHACVCVCILSLSSHLFLKVFFSVFSSVYALLFFYFSLTYLSSHEVWILFIYMNYCFKVFSSKFLSLFVLTIANLVLFFPISFISSFCSEHISSSHLSEHFIVLSFDHEIKELKCNMCNGVFSLSENKQKVIEFFQFKITV